MLTILLWIAQVLTSVSGQCMVFTQFIVPGGSSVFDMNNTRLVECVDRCLTMQLHWCKIIVFDPKQKTCRIYEDHRTKKCKGCVVMKKKNCKNVVDFQCFDYATYENGGLRYLFSMETERECRRVCVLIKNCNGYTWLRRTNRCGVQVDERVYIKRKLEDGEVAAFTRPKCDSNRCIIMKLNSKTKGKQRVSKATSFFECFQKLLLSDAIKAVDWQYQPNIYSHHTKNEVPVSTKSKKRLQAIKKRQCQGEDPDVCVKKSPNSEMEGGFLIPKMAEQECITLCLHAVNCAAVTWSARHECKFHHVIKKSYKNKSKYTDYVIQECSVKNSMENFLTNHYGYKGTIPVAEKFSPSCFKCAFRCQLDQCPGFTCFKEGQGRPDLCTLDGSSEHSYVPKN